MMIAAMRQVARLTWLRAFFGRSPSRITIRHLGTLRHGRGVHAGRCLLQDDLRVKQTRWGAGDGRSNDNWRHDPADVACGTFMCGRWVRWQSLCSSKIVAGWHYRARGAVG